MGVVSWSSALLDRPQAPPRGPVTQPHQGDPVFLLRPAEGGYFYCHAWDGYVGFIRGVDIRRVDAEGLTAALPQPGPTRIDAAIEAGECKNVGGEAVDRPLEAGLVREDGQVIYPVRDTIPVLLIDEGIGLS